MDIKVDAAGLRALLEHAKRSGTVERWAELALDWADAAEPMLRPSFGENPRWVNR